MLSRTILVSCLSISSFFCCVSLCSAQYCDFPPKEIIQGEHREYRGTYENLAYRYSVVVPADFVGYDDINPFYWHGFGTVVGTEQPSYLFVNGEPNSLEFTRPSDAAARQLKYLQWHHHKVDRSEITELQVDQLKAALLTVAYACPGSTKKYVMSSMVAISPDQSTLYEVTIYSHADRFERDQPIFNAVVKSWRYIPEGPGGRNLPEGVLKQLASVAKEYCEDQFEEGFRRGCPKKFVANLRWRELSITPSHESGILVENDNTGYCGSGGCALYLFVRRTDKEFTQVLGAQGGLGTLEEVEVLDAITKGHFDIRVTWSAPEGHAIYQWDGSEYAE
jgi:hypothetical protein